MQAPICPCCKYQPKLNKSGAARKGHVKFESVEVYTQNPKTPNSWDQITYSIGLCCLKCGVIFREVK